jgi:23S rRNA pseudouridine2457 synthase
MLVAFNKPYGVISQFTPDGSPNGTLAEFGFPRALYPIGRLDADSEGLLLLTDEGDMNERLLHPRAQHGRTYWALVERIPIADELDRLQKGVAIQDYKTLPCGAHILDPQPQIAPRDPPVRYRKNVPDVWLELTLTEGKNRQVRRMTAAIGHPTLRLIRVAIGRLVLAKLGLHPGQWRELTPSERDAIFLRGESGRRY